MDRHPLFPSFERSEVVSIRVVPNDSPDDAFVVAGDATLASIKRRLVDRGLAGRGAELVPQVNDRSGRSWRSEFARTIDVSAPAGFEWQAGRAEAEPEPPVAVAAPDLRTFDHVQRQYDQIAQARVEAERERASATQASATRLADYLERATRSEVQRATETYEAQVRRLQGELRELREASDKVRYEADRQLRLSREEADARITRIEDRYEGRIASMEERHASALRTLRAEHESAMERIEQRHRAGVDVDRQHRESIEDRLRSELSNTRAELEAERDKRRAVAAEAETMRADLMRQITDAEARASKVNAAASMKQQTMAMVMQQIATAPNEAAREALMQAWRAEQGFEPEPEDRVGQLIQLATGALGALQSAGPRQNKRRGGRRRPPARRPLPTPPPEVEAFRRQGGEPPADEAPETTTLSDLFGGEEVEL